MLHPLKKALNVILKVIVSLGGLNQPVTSEDGATFGQLRTLVTGYSVREKADFDAEADDFLPQSLVIL